MKNNFSNKEIYSVVDFRKNYVSLIVCVYEFSQFYILFNKKKYLENEEENIFLNEKKATKFLKELIYEVENELSFKIQKIYYNIDIYNLVIKKKEFYYNFREPKKITLKEFEILNDNFKKSILNIEKKEVVFSKINKYYLIDLNESYDYFPIGKTVSSLKFDAFIYYENWENLFFYENIFKNFKLQVLPPLLLPYAIYISLLFSQKEKDVVILNWKEKEIQVFNFENKVFTKFFTIKEGIDEFLKMFCKKTGYEFKIIKQYLYNVINLDPKREKVFDIYYEAHDEKAKKMSDFLKEAFINYFQSVFSKINSKLYDEKNNNSVWFLINDITNISGIFEMLEATFENIKFKKHNPLFVGIKNYNDSFLIGNAYYHHLKNKIIYN